MKKYFLFLLLFFAAVEASCQLNYFDYHAKMTEAEDSLITGREKSAFEIYKKTFTEYDFVFPRDCLIAAQFAYYYGDKDLSLAFLKKGFDWGLMPFHITRCPVFKNSDLTFLRRAEKEYLSGREKYLKRINPDIVEKALDIRWRDQLYKTINRKYSFSKSGEVVFDSIRSQNMELIVQLSLKYGFPGQRVIGIVHNNILQELGRDSTMDLLNRYNLFLQKKEYHIDKGQFELNSLTMLSNDAFIGALLHHPCAFQKLGKEFLIKSIKSGFIHPNDYGVLYEAQSFRQYAKLLDGTLDSFSLHAICINDIYNGGYGIYRMYDKNDSIRINENRKRIGMCTIAHSRDFYLFAEKKGMIVRFGYMEWK